MCRFVEVATGAPRRIAGGDERDVRRNRSTTWTVSAAWPSRSAYASAAAGKRDAMLMSPRGPASRASVVAQLEAPFAGPSGGAERWIDPPDLRAHEAHAAAVEAPAEVERHRLFRRTTSRRPPCPRARRSRSPPGGREGLAARVDGDVRATATGELAHETPTAWRESRPLRRSGSANDRRSAEGSTATTRAPERRSSCVTKEPNDPPARRPRRPAQAGLGIENDVDRGLEIGREHTLLGRGPVRQRRLRAPVRARARRTSSVSRGERESGTGRRTDRARARCVPRQSRDRDQRRARCQAPPGRGRRGLRAGGRWAPRDATAASLGRTCRRGRALGAAAVVRRTLRRQRPRSRQAVGVSCASSPVAVARTSPSTRAAIPPPSRRRSTASRPRARWSSARGTAKSRCRSTSAGASTAAACAS